MTTALRPTLPLSRNNSFGELMDLWQRQPYTYDSEKINFQALIQTNPALKLVLNVGPCVTWILNVRTGRYIFASDTTKRLTGYPSEDFIKGGMEYLNDLIHPDDSIWLWKLMRQVWDFLLAQPAHQREGYQFNCDYRLRKANGAYIRLLEQNVVLQTDTRGNITHLLGICTDITNRKSNDILTASVLSTEDETCLLCSSADEDLQPNELLSNREKEIVKLVAAGYSSKCIADRLSISFHTVNTHRKKIIQKTSTKTAGGLVQFAITNGII